jgi:hypothetical protein
VADVHNGGASKVVIVHACQPCTPGDEVAECGVAEHGLRRAFQEMDDVDGNGNETGSHPCHPATAVCGIKALFRTFQAGNAPLFMGDGLGGGAQKLNKRSQA